MKRKQGQQKNRYVFSEEERRRGGQAGFRAAVLKVQIEQGLDFNHAVQWLKRRIGWRKDTKWALRYG